MADTFASQSFARLASALESALAKGALSGDRALLEDLRREMAAIQSAAVRPAVAPVVFRGRKQLVFEALLAGATNSEAARSCGTNREQVGRWANKDTVFREELAKAKADRVAAAQATMAEMLPLAVRRLRGVLMDPGAKHGDLIAAAREVMDRAGMPRTERHEVAVTGADDLADRPMEELDAIEAKLSGQLRLIEGGQA